ncbi:tRNA (adenosine(37)-N6)-threonylcarbamoyltransferase complex transferase subunit TsaD [Clostridium sp. 'deep sea']|uniref:tRNA (adenosine(37)-N6)-threonylcarbamoyltransferase complex transferase subunit TsaD n=1 Tax=Clostridium sp. 'deep sea' TaxID=2779445 RepID=UPI001896A2AB|nr:tRNA (adenosine(37)-N6)-threonylcarbamoyltransferase complex transferase subunit TsaD [Clostridium sp. 'deep sea']QOR34689.1 tRNA (adenosine(37)-N6)-threonylcarbamoyltransferase complex transferase subunit TsaD [Clostridium sp. 'deep sea']
MKTTTTILAIETSCDETSVAIVQDGHRVLANEISSQIDLHRLYGGVVPEIASRRHIKNIVPVYKAALQQAGLTMEDIDAIAVTAGPGLIGALLIGLSFAKALAFGYNKPLVTINHLAGHLYGSFIDRPNLQLPLIALVVSGGHTELIYMEEHLKFERIAHTRDDAAGEAFDKIARRLGLGYPGGPVIENISLKGDNTAFAFPRAFAKEDTLDFSFSGLKSAVINVIHKHEQKNIELPVNDIAASFQQAVVDVLVENTIKAAKLKQVNQVALAGGVAANTALRQQLTKALQKHNIKLFYPQKVYCTDNAAMVGVAGYHYYKQGLIAKLNANAYATLPITEHPQ